MKGWAMAEQGTTQTIEGEDGAGKAEVPNGTVPDDGQADGGFLQHSNGNVDVAIETLIAVQGLSPLLTAFAKKLGDELGDGATILIKAWMHRGSAIVRARVHRGSGPVQTELPEHVEVLCAISSDTPDEARLALLDIDPTAPELRGATLHWNAEHNQWQPGESAEPEHQ